MPASPLPVLAGVFPVFQTPYRDDECIDFPVLDRELDWLFEQGADGVVLAMVSEVLRLATDERRELAEHVCRRAAGRPAVISVGAESTHSAVALARHAEQAGAAAVMAIPPVATALGEEQLLAYYRTLFEAVHIPVIVQDASGYVGRPMSIDMQAALLNEFGERAYFKPEAAPIGQKLSALRDATQGRARVFEGSGGIFLVDSFRRGIVGTMPGAEIADAIVVLWQALQRGDEARVRELALPIASLVALQTGLDGYLAVEKHLLVKRGIFDSARIRGPVGYQLDAETAAEVDRLFDLLMSRV